MIKRIAVVVILLFTSCSSSLEVAHISDLHISDNNEYALKVIDEINKKKPDLVLITGDITNDGTPEQIELAFKTLDKIESEWHYVFGNHDYYWRKGIGEYWSKKEKGIYIVGLDPGFGRDWDKASYDKTAINNLLSKIPKGSNIILMSHYPFVNHRKVEVLSLLKDYNIVLALSGHWHSNNTYYSDVTFSSAVTNNIRKNHEGTGKGYKYYIITKTEIIN